MAFYQSIGLEIWAQKLQDTGWIRGDTGLLEFRVPVTPWKAERVALSPGSP